MKFRMGGSWGGGASCGGSVAPGWLMARRLGRGVQVSEGSRESLSRTRARGDRGRPPAKVELCQRAPASLRLVLRTQRSTLASSRLQRRREIDHLVLYKATFGSIANTDSHFQRAQARPVQLDQHRRPKIGIEVNEDGKIDNWKAIRLK